MCNLCITYTGWKKEGSGTGQTRVKKRRRKWGRPGSEGTAECWQYREGVGTKSGQGEVLLKMALLHLSHLSRSLGMQRQVLQRWQPLMYGDARWCSNAAKDVVPSAQRQRGDRAHGNLGRLGEETCLMFGLQSLSRACYTQWHSDS